MPRLHRSVPQGEVPRFVPDQPLPPYSFVPGRFPHPVNDPQGHSFGADPPPAELLDPDRWQICRAYLYGVDLFNHGYYWEAHESWEGLWLACGRTGRSGRPAGPQGRRQRQRGLAVRGGQVPVPARDRQPVRIPDDGHPGDLDAEDESKAVPVVGAGEDDGIDFRFVDSEDDFLEAFRSGGKGRKVDHAALDREKLEGVLRDLIACRQMLDRVMKDG